MLSLLPPTRITHVTFVGAQNELKLFLYLVGTPDFSTCADRCFASDNRKCAVCRARIDFVMPIFN